MENPKPQESPFGQEAPRPNSGPRDKIKGVFSTQTISKVGTGTTTRKTIQKSFWFAEEGDDGSVEVQPVNANYVPSGPKRRVPKDDFLAKFSPEPEFYVSTVFPKMRELDHTIVKGEDHREKGETFSAEFEFQNALAVDEDNVRANFGLGLTYLDRGETGKADNIFERLVKLDAAFQPEHKHLFNDFGISLRKNRMYDQALNYYTRAMELTKADENLHYNMARALFEKGEMEAVAEHLGQALAINPDLEAARKFSDWLREKGVASGGGGASAPSASGAGPETGGDDFDVDVPSI